MWHAFTDKGFHLKKKKDWTLLLCRHRNSFCCTCYSKYLIKKLISENCRTETAAMEQYQSLGSLVQTEDESCQLWWFFPLKLYITIKILQKQNLMNLSSDRGLRLPQDWLNSCDWAASMLIISNRPSSAQQPVTADIVMEDWGNLCYHRTYWVKRANVSSIFIDYQILGMSWWLSFIHLFPNLFGNLQYPFFWALNPKLCSEMWTKRRSSRNTSCPAQQHPRCEKGPALSWCYDHLQPETWIRCGIRYVSLISVS